MIRIKGDSKRPRLAVFRSARAIYAQIIDDVKGQTLVAFSSKNLLADQIGGKTKLEVAALVGDNIAKLAQKAKVAQVVYDKRRFKYHGRVKALAEAARKGGLEF